MDWQILNSEDFKSLVKELRQVAVDEPCNPLKILPKGPPQKFHRYLILQQIPVHLCFTVTQVGARKFYQLSCQDARDKPLPDETVRLLTDAFFDGEFCEIPSLLHGPRVRQFLQDFDDNTPYRK